MQSLIKSFEQADIKADIENSIEQNRKNNFIVKVLDKNGESISGATVSLKQTNHAFKFGVNLFMLESFDSEQKNRLYEQQVSNLFNMGVVPIYWDTLEPEQSKPRFKKDSPYIYRRPPVDTCLEFCEKHNITPKAHCLSFDFFLPDWICGKTYAEHNSALENRYKMLSERYSKSIKYWEVINETLFDKAKTDFYFEPDLIEWAFEKAIKYFPDNILTINENAKNLYPKFLSNRSQYYLLIEKLLNNGVRIDKLGFQAHFMYGADYTKKYSEPNFIKSFFKRYSDFNLPMQITEVSIPAKVGDVLDYDLQAELTKHLYSLWFSIKEIDEIVYWNLPDGYAYMAEPGDMTKGENIWYAGLLSFDLSRKKAYNELDNLINKKWRTNLTQKTNLSGVISGRAFKGDYEVCVNFGHNKIYKNAQINEKNSLIEVII